MRCDAADEHAQITNVGTASQDMIGWRVESYVGDQW